MLYNEVLAGRYNRLLQRLLSMKGGPPSPQLSGDISCGIELESDRPEWAFLKGENFYTAVAEVPAGVTFNSRSLFNCQTPGVLYVIERLRVTTQATAIVQFKLSGNVPIADFASPALEIPRDTRANPGNSTSQSAAHLSFRADDTGTTGNLFHSTPIIINTPYVYDSPIIMVRPSAIEVRCLTINTGFYLTVDWRERGIEESELGIGP